jgi:hypothetical protein
LKKVLVVTISSLYNDYWNNVLFCLRALLTAQLIRMLHITEPVHHVMCLIGKRYPATSDEFYVSRLPGTFNPELAGKRMRLPTPETWETQVSISV